MQMLGRIGVLMALWYGGLNLLSSGSSGYDPEQVLQALRQNDEAAWRQYSLTVAVEEPPMWGGESRSFRLRATSEKTATVVIRDQTHYKGHRKYSSLQGSPWWGSPMKGGLGYGRDCDVWYLQEKGYCAELSRTETLVISPNDQLVESYRWGHQIEIYSSPGQSYGYSLITQAQQGLGRGFGRLLGRALSVRELPDGRLELWATDKEFPEARWRLVVDPSHRFLVVLAEKIVDGKDGKVEERWQFEGIVEGPIPLARRGTCLDEGLRDISELPVYRFECVSYEPCFRQDWYNEARQMIRRPPAGTQVWDLRVEPFTAFTIK